jgi:hypothetical protein
VQEYLKISQMRIPGIKEYCQKLYHAIKTNPYENKKWYKLLYKICNKESIVIWNRITMLYPLALKIPLSSDCKFLKNSSIICFLIFEKIHETSNMSKWLRKIEVELLNNIEFVEINKRNRKLWDELRLFVTQLLLYLIEEKKIF